MLRNKEELRKEVDNLKNENKLIIVEGPKDRDALMKLGLNNITMLSKAPLFKIVEQVAEKADEAAILTDTDGKGKELYHILYRDLQKRGVKIDNRLRDLLFREKISHVEGLATYLS